MSIISGQLNQVELAHDDSHPLFVGGGNVKGRQIKSLIFSFGCFTLTFLVLGVVGYLLVDTFFKGAQWFSLDFFNSFASRFPDRSGIKAPLYGTVWLVVITLAFSVPVGVITGVYLEVLMERGKLYRLISNNINNLAGVPSVVYGLFGLAIFVRFLGFERSVLSGGLTLGIMSLPTIVISTREAIYAIPPSIRLGALALGATKWQTTRDQIFPTALPGIMTGVILSLSRALGETAPLIIAGAASFLAFVPQSPFDSYTALPMQIYNWVSKPQEEFHQLAAAAIIVLLGVLMVANSLAIFIRIRSRRVKL
jgi:phosphate transport system permease protein